MEVYVSINFKYDEPKIQKVMTHAFEYLDSNSYLKYIAKDRNEKYDSFIGILEKIFGDKLDKTLLEKHPKDYFCVEEIRVNKGGSTTVEFMTGSSGQEFIRDLESFLKSHYADKVKAKMSGFL